jgi:hypothetical protein
MPDDRQIPSETQALNVKIGDEELKGRYSNLLRIAHTREEFILDFINVVPPQATVVSRVAISPGHLKRIIRALADNVDKYEKAYGEIRQAPEPTGSAVN